MTTHDPHLLALRSLAAPLLERDNPLVHLSELTLSAQGAAVCGHILIDLLEEHDLAIGDYELVIAPAEDAALAAAMIHAAGGRGLDLDAAVFRPCAESASQCGDAQGTEVFCGAPVRGRTAVLLANTALASVDEMTRAIQACGTTIVGIASLLPDEAAKVFAATQGFAYCVPSLGD